MQHASLMIIPYGVRTVKAHALLFAATHCVMQSKAFNVGYHSFWHRGDQRTELYKQTVRSLNPSHTQQHPCQKTREASLVTQCVDVFCKALGVELVPPAVSKHREVHLLGLHESRDLRQKLPPETALKQTHRFVAVATCSVAAGTKRAARQTCQTQGRPCGYMATRITRLPASHSGRPLNPALLSLAFY